MNWRKLTPSVVLVASLLLTAIATWTIVASGRARDEARFMNAVQSTGDRIAAQLETYTALLRGGTGLFAALDTVTYDDFFEYTQRVEIAHRYPGIQGFGFSRLVAPGQMDALAAAMVAEGFPDFHFHPDSASGPRHAILYLEPMDARNRVALGYDMFSHPVRREAMTRAWEQGTAAMSGRVRLVQEISGREQAGFLIYLPVYRGGSVPSTLSERLGSLVGFVYAPFRADDLFQDIFGTEERPGVAFQIYDGAIVRPTHLLHDSRVGGIVPAPHPTFQRTTRQYFAGRTWTIAYAQTAFAQTHFWNSLAPFVAGFGLLMSLMLFVMTRAQMRAASALEERERELSTMADSIPQLAWMADESGKVLWFNERWYAYTGIAREGGPENWEQAYDPAHVGRVVTRFRHHVESGEPWEDLFPLRGQDGSYRWFLAQAVPIRSPQGKVVRWFGTNTDISEQMKARDAEAKVIREQAAREAAEAREEQLRLQSVELARSNRELQDFAYVASHDLQEPLRKISSFSDLLIREYADQLGEQGMYYAERMQNAARRMSRLIKDLLAFSRVSTRTRPFVAVNLNDVIADVLGDLSVRLDETGGTVEVDDLPTVTADPMQMRQLFQNLIGNALKFHRPGVPPEVRLQARLQDSSQEPGARETWQITVEDNGIGFDEKYLDRIFTPFQRLHTQDEFEGTGIGLAIVRRIAERHGGTLTARSTPGEGSTFIVELPVHHAAGFSVL